MQLLALHNSVIEIMSSLFNRSFTSLTVPDKVPLFALSTKFDHHIAVHPRDLALDPPESYLFIQDGLILSCAIAWAVAYLLIIRNTLRDGRSACWLHSYAFNLSYELYYGLIIPETWIGRCLFVAGWFFLDTIWMFAIRSVTPARERKHMAITIIVESIALTLLYHLTSLYITEDIQCGAYWYGILAHFVDCLGLLIVARRTGETGGMSMSFHVVGYAGFFLAIAVFAWRYVNVPQNWGYVASPASVIAWLTCLGMMIYGTGLMLQGTMKRNQRSFKGKLLKQS